MTWEWEPEFLTREIVDAIHEDQIDKYGELRDVSGAESPGTIGTGTHL
jgi:hypothetical protein